MDATAFIGVFEGFLFINVFSVFNTAVEFVQCVQYSISLSTAKASFGAKVTLDATAFIGVFEGFLVINVFNVFNTAVEFVQCVQYNI